MENIFKNMQNLADGFIADAEKFIDQQKQYNMKKQMKKQVKVSALPEEGGMIVSGWFTDVNDGEKYAAAMMQRGYVCVKQYREAQQ